MLLIIYIYTSKIILFDFYSSDVPILQAHGDCDPVVPYRWGQMTSTAMKGFVKNHEFKTYKGLAHSSGSAELQDIRQFLVTRLPPISP